MTDQQQTNDIAPGGSGLSDKLCGVGNINKAIEHLALEECEFDDECDFCKSPENGSFADFSISECGSEVNYYICGKCAVALAEQDVTA